MEKRDYSSVTQDEIDKFFIRLKRTPEKDRQQFYDDNLRIVRGYLIKLGIPEKWFSLVAINEKIREVLLNYVVSREMNKEASFREDGIYVGNEIIPTFRVESRERVLKVAEAIKEVDEYKRNVDSPDSANSIHQVGDTFVEYEMNRNPILSLNYNFTLIPPLAKMIKQGINYAGKSESFFKRFQSPKFEIIGDIVFLDNENLIATTKNKKDERIAIITMSRFGNKCNIKLVDEFGVVNYVDDRQTGGNRSFEQFDQRMVWSRIGGSKGKSSIQKVERSRFNSKEHIHTFLDNGDPISLGENDTWIGKKNHLLSYFDMYPKFKEWFYTHLENPISILDTIYQEQEVDFESEIKRSQTRVNDAVVSMQTRLYEMDLKIREIIANIEGTRIDAIKAHKITAFKRAIQENVGQVFGEERRKKIENLIQASVNLAIGVTSEERDIELDVGEEKTKFDTYGNKYQEEKDKKSQDKDVLEEMTRLLYERHKALRKVSVRTSKKSTYDDAVNAIEGEERIVSEASEIVTKASSQVFLLPDNPGQNPDGNVDITQPIVAPEDVSEDLMNLF